MREDDALVDWLQQVGRALEDSPWASALALSGCSAFDVLLSPLYIRLLRYSRSSCSQTSDAAPPLPRATRLQVRARREIDRWMAVAATGRPRAAQVVFWPREPTHVVTMVPTAAALRHKGVSVCFLANRPAISARLREAGERPVYLPSLSPRQGARAARAGARAALALDLEPGPWPPFPGGEGAPAAFVVRSVLQETLPFLHRMDSCLQAALERIRPRVMVVGNDLTMEGRLGAHRAREQGIPTACLSHGLAVGNPLVGMHVVDRMLVYGDLDRDDLVRRGLPDARVTIVGAPHLDERARQSGRIDASIAARYGLGARPYVLVATSGAGMFVSQRHHEAVIHAVQTASARLPDVDFVARLHRKDDPELYRRLAAASPGARLTVVGKAERQGLPDDISGWLQGCAAVITGASTSAVDATLMGVPVITVDLANELGRADFIAAGASVHVTTGDELVDAVERVAVRKEVPASVRARAEAYVESMYGRLDGRSADRAAAALIGLL